MKRPGVHMPHTKDYRIATTWDQWSLQIPADTKILGDLFLSA